MFRLVELVRGVFRTACFQSHFTCVVLFVVVAQIRARHVLVPDTGNTLANFFTPQVNNVEKMFLTAKATYPVERTLLTTGLTAAGVESLFQGETRQETPHLKIAYQPTKESTFWRS